MLITYVNTSLKSNPLEIKLETRDVNKLKMFDLSSPHIKLINKNNKIKITKDCLYF